MDFLEVIQQARSALQREGRITYRTLKRQFDLDDEALDDLTYELIEGQEVATDKDGKMLVWTGSETPEQTASQTLDAPVPELSSPTPSAQPKQEAPTNERRQLTVMFCDLVGSTALSAQLDPEELQTVVRTYQEVSAEVIERYEGYIAQYLGDGLLVYFGYPAAHEDDAARSIRAGLEIVTALDQARDQFIQPVQVRIGIHTGLVVVGQMGGGSRREQLALGETPNIAARVQGKAQPDQVVISDATRRLVTGLFETDDLGLHELKGVAAPQPLFHVTAESTAHSRFEVAVQHGLTPLVGRETEVDFLHQRWTQAQAGNGQAVLVSGEPGIGKSRLVQELKDRAAQDGAAGIAFQCSPYHQNSVLYPVIVYLERLLQFTTDDTPQTKLDKLQQTLGHYRFPQTTTAPLLAALLSLPQPAGAPPLTMSPQKQKELTQQTLVQWLLEEAEQTAVICTWEDLHWADPSTLELLTTCLDQIPAAPMLALLVFRPEFTSVWGTRSYLSQLSLNRLDRSQVEHLAERVTRGRSLPVEVVQQIAEKTDGVPLFVEELTKTILESGVLRAVNSHYELTGPLSSLAIPSTLHDSLMARLDRLTTAKEVAQLGATIGREFSYTLLRAVSPLKETSLQHSLKQLVEAELVYQRGVLPQAHYLFKHALVQDTAYESLLKSKRQALHTQIAQVLEAQFPETTATQPELVARHYTEASLNAEAIPYWQKAGERANQRSANVEAINYFRQGMALLQSLPDTPERAQQELPFQVGLGGPLIATTGWISPEVGAVYTRARELCREVGETPQIFPVLWGLCAFHSVRADWQTATELAEQLLSIAQSVDDDALLIEAHYAMGQALSITGEFARGREHFEQLITLYDPEQHHTLAFVYGLDPGVMGRAMLGYSLSFLGYLDQARKASQAARSLAQELSHPNSLAFALSPGAWLQQRLRNEQGAQEQGEAVMALATEQGYPFYLMGGTMLQGYLRVAQGDSAGGLAQMLTALDANQAPGSRIHFLSVLAEVYGQGERSQDGLPLLVEAITLTQTTGERTYAAECHRLKGELLLNNDECKTMNDERKTPQAKDLSHAAEAEACFRTAIDIAQQQQAKLWELRAAGSLARLWLQQGKKDKARELFTPVYEWFTEGFDTQDLKDAKALLEELS